VAKLIGRRMANCKVFGNLPDIGIWVVKLIGRSLAILVGDWWLKAHKHEIILIFFYLNQNLICPWSIFKKISIIFLRFSPEFRCSNIFAEAEHTRNPIFW
jgi:hypothetical protein